MVCGLINRFRGSTPFRASTFDLTSLTLKHIVQYMKRLTMEQKTRVVAALVEGNSIRSTVRMTGVAKNTVIKLVLDLADACAAYHDRNVRNLRVRRLQCDEIWQYVGAKAKNTSPEKKAIGWGDVWTWTAIDADTKLCVSYLVGGRDLGWAKEFMRDCASRIKNRVQITTDGIGHIWKRWKSVWCGHRLRAVAEDLRRADRRMRRAILRLAASAAT